MRGDITLSPKYGVNPAIPLCFYCNKQKNENVLAGLLPGDVEAPRNVVWDARPCAKCDECMTMGVLLISATSASLDAEYKAKKEHDDHYHDPYRHGGKKKHYMVNPYRTGGWCVMSEDYIRRVFGPGGLFGSGQQAESLLARRFSFVADEVWLRLGLPGGPNKENVNVPEAKQDGEAVAGGPGVAAEQGPGDQQVQGEGGTGVPPPVEGDRPD